jgi:hypothetical protein
MVARRFWLTLDAGTLGASAIAPCHGVTKLDPSNMTILLTAGNEHAPSLALRVSIRCSREQYVASSHRLGGARRVGAAPALRTIACTEHSGPAAADETTRL